jgi:twitching motility protein PilT
VDQREVGTDTPSAPGPRVRSLRQDPDVIMVSQIRDAPSAWAALQAAETGRLVLSSLSTVSVVDTMERFIDMFQPHQQRQARASLAGGLRGVISQRLLPRAGGRGRVPAVEVLIVNSRVSERIAEPDRLGELDHEMAAGDLYGMQTFDQSLVLLYQDGLVTRADVLAHASEPSEMKFELDRADFERGGAPPQAGNSGPPPPQAHHEPGDPLPQRLGV